MIRKRIGKRTQNNENPGLDISSLIDVSFLLLIYFLITSTLDPKEGDLVLLMGGRSPDNDPIHLIDRPEIEVDALGVVYFTGEMVDSNPDSRDLVVLTDRLDMYLQAHLISDPTSEPGVDLIVDDNVRGQRFIDVMNCLGGLGIKNVAIQGLGEE